MIDSPVAAEGSSKGPERATESRFSIVGVGASAGGLAATSELLRHLGPDPGVAIVVVHHLDPRHESSLVSIFARLTEMPVEAARDGVRPEASHVYVVPPNAGVVIEDGALVLTQRLEQGGVHLPIDQFLESLAEECGPAAIGVLLSGNGADGTRGLTAIKASGGITLVQDASAEFPSMPETAIAAGCVDLVLPTAQIAAELRRIGSQSVALPPAAPSSESEDPAAFARLIAHVRKLSGIDLSNYKHGTIRRRAQRRMFLRGIADLNAYAELLKHDPAEAKKLTEEVLIHVTSFFRDPETFDMLASKVFGALVESRDRDAPIRIWVPGCSTGEEVYSLAIALFEFLEASGLDLPIQLFGTDISAFAVDRARAGKYPRSIARDVTPARVERFFTQNADSLQINKDVRDLCVFAQHDVTRDPPFSRMDLVSCRNLMIYFGPALQDRVLPVFHYALRSPGFLLLGSAETARDFPGFSCVDPTHKIYARNANAPRPSFDLGTHELSAALTTSAVLASTTQPHSDALKEADRLVLAALEPPGFVVSDDLSIVQFRGAIGPYLEPSSGRASLDLMHMLREELRLPVRRAIDEARSQQKAELVRSASVHWGAEPVVRTLSIEAIPFIVAPGRRRFFVVLLREASKGAAEDSAETAERLGAQRRENQSETESELARELTSTRSYLQSVIERLESSNEELRAAHEEVVSSNEELHSTNEELQTAKEEAQATNEELRTLNDELGVRNVESRQLNDDLSNVLASVALPIVILGRDGRIRRFTAAATRLFRLVPTDIGRPIADIKPLIRVPDLSELLSTVLTHFHPVERVAQDHEGHWYQLTFRPYMTQDNRIDGTLLVAADIDRIKRAELLLTESHAFGESVFETVSECLLVVDQELRIRSANAAFLGTFGLTREGIQGRSFHAVARESLGAGATAVLDQLGELGKGASLEDFRVRLTTTGGERVFLLAADTIKTTPWTLLTLTDATDRERSVLRKSESRFRGVLATAVEGILMTDPAGRIEFANPMAAQMFGYEPDELNGMNVDTLLPDGLRASHAEHRQTYLASPSARMMGSGRELVGRRKDGAEIPVEVGLSVMMQEDEPLVVAFITNVSRKREAERMIREYQEKLQNLAFERATSEERERRRLAVELHDHVGQALALALIKLTGIRGALPNTAVPAVNEAIELLEQSVRDTRTLTFDLSPPVLYDLGLKEALAWLAEQFESQHGLHVELVDDQLEKPLDQVTAALVFRAVRELLMNVIKHAESPGAKLSLRRIDDKVEIAVEDRGSGFDDAQGTSPATGFGLFSVREQVMRLGGTFDLQSAANRGTHVKLLIPLRGAGAERPTGTMTEEGAHEDPARR